MSPHTDLILESSNEASILSPHLPSPSLQETSSPIFSSNLNNSVAVTAYRTPSIDLHRRSSLQMVDSARMSEPNIFRRSSLDPLSSQKMGGGFNFHQDGGSYTSPLVHSPTQLMQGSSHSPQQCGGGINQVASSSGLTVASSQDVLQTERSKSLENINCSLQPIASQPYKRRMSTQVPLIGGIPSKRPR